MVKSRNDILWQRGYDIAYSWVIGAHDGAHCPNKKIVEDLYSDDSRWTFPAERFSEWHGGQEATILERLFWSRGLEWNRSNLLKMLDSNSEECGDLAAAMNEQWFVNGFKTGMWMSAIPMLVSDEEASQPAVNIDWRVERRDAGM